MIINDPFPYETISARILSVMCLGDSTASNEMWQEGLCSRGMDWLNGEINDVIVIENSIEVGSDNHYKQVENSKVEDSTISDENICTSNIIEIIEKTMSVQIRENFNEQVFQESHLYDTMKDIVEDVSGEECQDINTESLLKDEKFDKIKNRIKQILDA